MEESPRILAGSPLYFITGKHRCESCTQEVEVIALAAGYIWEGEDPEEPEEDIVGNMLSSIEQMPSEILATVKSLHPRYGLHRSEIFERDCYANRCTCGAWFEDYELHQVPRGTFFPICPEDAQGMTQRILPFQGYFPFQCRFGWGSGLFIFAWAKKIPNNKP